jgi:RNA polymerase sigma-70 factor (ECF subfamily)
MEGTPVLSLVPPPGERPLSQLEDDALMQLAAAGKSAAFACLVRRHQASVRAFCARVCGAAQGDDVAQDVFVALHRAAPSYVPEGRFRSYLFTIAARRCKNAQRQVRTRREELVTLEREEPSGKTGLDAILVEERRRRLHALVADLPEAQRTAIQMRFSAGLDYAEVAEATGCPEPTARTRVHLGLAKLRELLQKRGGL